MSCDFACSIPDYFLDQKSRNCMELTSFASCSRVNTVLARRRVRGAFERAHSVGVPGGFLVV